LNHKFYHNHVLLDVDLINEIYGNNIDEIFPLILHEIGHIFNVPNENFKCDDKFKEMYDEFFADDYVRGLGFEKELLRSLETYKKWLIKNNKEVNKLIDFRINRIANKKSPYHKIYKGVNFKTLSKRLKKKLKNLI